MLTSALWKYLIFLDRHQRFLGCRHHLSWNRLYSRCAVKMKLESPEFQSIFTPELITLAELFKKYNYELRIAGGAVRDLLMNKVPEDIDFATTARPDEMMAMFTREQVRMINRKGETHGTVTPRINDKTNYEVTTLRVDRVTDGRHAEVEFTKDWEIDASRRDLTVNSMFLGLDGTLYDYFSGKEDLEQRKVAFVGDANLRIQEDYLRILRYFRFYGRIANTCDEHDLAVLDTIKDNVSGLKGISGERIWVELKKIAGGRFAGPILRKIIGLDMGQYIGFPSCPNLRELDIVWNRSEAVMKPMTLVSSIMNDIDEVYKFDERVKLSNDDRNLGLFIVTHRSDPRLINNHSSNDAPSSLKQLVMGTYRKENTGKVLDRCSELLKYHNAIDLLSNFQVWVPPKFPVTGGMIMNRGVPKSRAISRIYEELRDTWIQSDFSLTADELLDLVDDVKDKYIKKTTETAKKTGAGTS